MAGQPTFEESHADYLRWVRATFPEETVTEQLEHLKEEFDELYKNPLMPDEYADVLMLLLCVANGNGIDIFKAFRDKFAVNQCRTWEKTERGFRHTPEKEELWEGDMLLAIAGAQGVLLKASLQILARDKHDGIRAVGWMRQHEEVFSKVLDDCDGGPVEDDIIKRAMKLAGDPEV